MKAEKKRPKPPSRNQRMLWIIEKWRAAHDNRPFTVREAAARWAMAQGLLDEEGEHTCVHCGCTDSEGCPPGCWWVDFEETVCSTCLLKRADEFTAGDLIDVERAFDALAIDHSTPRIAGMQQGLVLATILTIMPPTSRVRGWCQNCQTRGPLLLADGRWCATCAPGCRKARDRKRRKESRR